MNGSSGGGRYNSNNRNSQKNSNSAAGSNRNPKFFENRNPGDRKENDQSSRYYLPQAKTLGDNYVDDAERLISEIYSDKNSKKITTSKIRGILSMVNELYNAEKERTEKKLSDESIAGVQLLRVRLFYECGRDETVKSFVLKTSLIDYLKDIGYDREKFIKYAHYVEALVAYHRYFGGKN